MKKTKFLAVTLVIMLVLSIFCINTKAFASDVEPKDVEPRDTENTAENVSNEEDELDIYKEGANIYSGDLYVLFGEDDYSATTYVMDKNVDGNVFIFGQDVKIKGQINGSLFVFASSLTIEESGYVACDTFVFADTVKHAGNSFDMYAACKNFEMTDTGYVYRDLKVGANTAHLYGRVGRDLDLEAENISVYENDEKLLTVGKDFRYSSGKEIENVDKIKHNGEILFTKLNEDTSDDNLVSGYVYRAFENIIFALVIYAVLIFLAPKFIEKSKEYVSTRGLLAAAIGLAFTVLLPIIAFLIIFTVIGASISFTMFMIYALVLMLNSTVVTIAINEFIVNKVPALNATWKKILMIIPVSLVIFLIRQIPLIGGWITFIILLIGTGIVVLYQFDKRKKETVNAE